MVISIIVPVYNVREYVIKCLESIYNQTMKEYEVIIVDDGSTDGSGELVDKYCEGKKQFTIIHKKNGGLMSAWMEGVRLASGEYLGFVDSDDYIEPQMFEQLATYAQKYKCDIVMCDRYDVKNDVIKYRPSCIEPGLYEGKKMDIIYKSILPTFNGEHITNARWNKIFNRDLFIKNTKYCEHLSRLCEDRFITPACVFSAESFYYLNKPFYYYVFRQGSNHSKASEKLYETMNLLYAIQKQMLIEKGMYEKYSSLVERASLNYLRLIIIRNFSRQVNKELRKKMAKQILENKTYIYCIQKYKNDLNGKLGWALKLLFKINRWDVFATVCKYVKR